MYNYNKSLKFNAQELRKNMTPEEKHLWYDFLKALPVSVKRQKNIENYILDFYIPSAKIAIELDGSQHYTPEHRLADTQRDARLESYGIKVLRYLNADVNDNFYTVCQDIWNNVKLRTDEINRE